ncbi:MAG: SMP-30/gluconolactonase/LRE family protein [Steroidobacteraceae bacterium]
MQTFIQFRRRFAPWVLGAVALVSLAACGGGGSGGSGSGSGGGGGGGSGGGTTSYTIGGSVSGLSAAGLVLTDNGGDSLSVPSGASTFTFSTALSAGAMYAVAVATQPSGELCSVSAGSGTASANVTSVAVSCVPQYTIGGAVSGLTASGLALQLNGTSSLSVPAQSSSYVFAQTLAAGTAYQVSIATQPTGETCTVSAPSGTASSNVTDANVSCSVQSFTVSGTVSGLATSGLKLQDYTAGETLSVAADATTFAFANSVPYGTNIAVTVAQQPYWDWCTAAAGNFTGPITANVTTESFSCASASASGSATASGTTFNSPAQLAIDGNGNLYVADSLNSRILEITPSGTVSTLISGLNGPEGVAVNATGTQLYVADTGNNRILEDALPGGTPTVLLGSGLNLPAGVAFDSANGDVIVADTGNSAIKAIAPNGTVSTLATSANGLNGPYGVAVSPAGTIYVANTGANTVVQISGGTVSLLPGTTAPTSSTAGTFTNPYGVTLDASGDVYVANTNAHTVMLVTPTGTVRTLAGSSTAGSCTASPPLFENPWGLAVSSSGVLYVADYSGNIVCTLTPGP